jgi:hypothetical protein
MSRLLAGPMCRTTCWGMDENIWRPQHRRRAPVRCERRHEVGRTKSVSDGAATSDRAAPGISESIALLLTYESYEDYAFRTGRETHRHGGLLLMDHEFSRRVLSTDASRNLRFADHGQAGRHRADTPLGTSIGADGPALQTAT